MENHFQKDISIIGGIAAVPNILNVVCKATGMGFAAIARVTDRQWIACAVRDDISFGLKPGGELELGTTICNEIRQTRQAVVIDHVAEDPLYRDHATPRQYGFQSYISMPIFLSGGRFFGTLCAIDPNPARLNVPEITGMFRLFSELIAFHIEASERLEVSESTLIVEREASELREQFIAVLGHDLRNPLGAVSVGVGILKNTTSDPRAAKVVGMIEKSISRMSELIEDVMDFARGRLGGGISVESRSDLPLEPVLVQVIEEAKAMWPDRVIEARFSIPDPIHFDRRRIAQLFTNLLVNAMTHGKAEKPVTVIATTGSGRLELSVANAADPIPPGKLEKLFHPFSRGESKQHQQGLGLGLYIASEIAKAHGGKLEVSSSAEETRFTFVMPLLSAS